MSRKFGFALTIALVALSAASNAVTIVQWNFNSNPADTLSTTGSLTPSIGTGIASLVGGTTESFASGTASGGSSDPAATDNTSWNTTTYAAQGTENGQRGVEFKISTVGYQDLVFTFDTRHSSTASRYVRVDYTLDGTVYNEGQVFDFNTDQFVNNNTVDLSSITGANNNANFGLRIVAIFEPGKETYDKFNLSSNYNPTGTMRYDMVTLSGTAAPVPEPASLIALGVGAVGLIARRRRK